MKSVKRRLEEHPFSKRLMSDERYRLITFAVFGLIFNLLYAFYNGALGLATGAVWFGASCVYYLLLSIMRFFAVLYERKNNLQKEIGIMKSIGVLIIIMDMILSVITYISLKDNVVTKYGTITMIAIATFTFTKITIAIIKFSNRKKDKSPIAKSVRSISYAEVTVSVFAMQRSMIESFGGMPEKDAVILNIFTGTAIWLLTLAIGIALIMSAKKEKNNGNIKAC